MSIITDLKHAADRMAHTADELRHTDKALQEMKNVQKDLTALVLGTGGGKTYHPSHITDIAKD